METKLRRLLMEHVNPRQVFSYLDPGLTLLDHTSARLKEKASIQAYLLESRRPFVLLPHAPHHTGTEAFMPFSDKTPLPDHADYWMPFIHDRVWKALPERRHQFFYAGYPGLDREWLEGCRTRQAFPGKGGASPLRCLFVIRRFRPEDYPDTGSGDPFIYSYREMVRYVQAVMSAIERWGKPVDLVIKPHPSNNRYLLRRCLNQWGLRNATVTYEPMYALLPRVDCVISLYSTVLITAALAGIPVALLHTSTQAFIHRWPPLEALYGGLKFYVRRPETFPARAVEFFRLAEQGKRIEEDVAHLRRFFPDNATERTLQRIDDLRGRV